MGVMADKKHPLISFKTGKVKYTYSTPNKGIKDPVLSKKTKQKNLYVFWEFVSICVIGRNLSTTVTSACAI